MPARQFTDRTFDGVALMHLQLAIRVVVIGNAEHALEQKFLRAFAEVFQLGRRQRAERLNPLADVAIEGRACAGAGDELQLTREVAGCRSLVAKSAIPDITDSTRM